MRRKPEASHVNCRINAQVKNTPDKLQLRALLERLHSPMLAFTITATCALLASQSRTVESTSGLAAVGSTYIMKPLTSDYEPGTF